MKSLTTRLTNKLNIEFPLIIAPMYMVSYKTMAIEAIKQGCIGSLASLNYKNTSDLENDIIELNKVKDRYNGTYAVNLLIVGNNNYKEHLDIVVKHKVPLIITSLGSPKEVVKRVHKYDGIVLADIVNQHFAKKAFKVNVDGVIAVGHGAGGHAGNNNLLTLIPILRKQYPEKIILSAGGIATGQAIAATIVLGSDGVSIGTPFINCKESPVSQEYKQAVINANIDDIVLSKALTGTPATVINCEELSLLEKKLSGKNISMQDGMKTLSSNDYKKIFMAGQSVGAINSIESVKNIIDEFKTKTINTLKNY